MNKLDKIKKETKNEELKISISKKKNIIKDGDKRVNK